MSAWYAQIEQVGGFVALATVCSTSTSAPCAGHSSDEANDYMVRSRKVALRQQHYQQASIAETLKAKMFSSREWRRLYSDGPSSNGSSRSAICS